MPLAHINVGGCQTVTRELVALAYFSVCLRRSLVTRASREVSACVGDRLTAAYINKVIKLAMNLQCF